MVLAWAIDGISLNPCVQNTIYFFLGIKWFRFFHARTKKHSILIWMSSYMREKKYWQRGTEWFHLISEHEKNTEFNDCEKQSHQNHKSCLCLHLPFWREKKKEENEERKVMEKKKLPLIIAHNELVCHRMERICMWNE